MYIVPYSREAHIFNQQHHRFDHLILIVPDHYFLMYIPPYLLGFILILASRGYYQINKCRRAKITYFRLIHQQNLSFVVLWLLSSESRSLGNDFTGKSGRG
ncbi:hypothetical protein K493DRAFT_83446 [Basidiobolus meristosporus CBS 931.73]|uniref:Uncharacterized protein n=1 Tax=Basidiobolus meristosporus CBS 931.73 TaxID=1314790 RepID=A0A1Y1YWI5_9FUNG|nr:hypothetical protein K493DRAFT_83446 [Basidiobolus meristosporus CBS 931.73]|eukprot:ORY02433.1 hypothetical protein K493DRAFT_83446 [Basidiobolus meristosporus CBS 931.73]